MSDKIFGDRRNIGKGRCRVATTANITLSGEQTVDTVALVEGDHCMVKNQTAPAENGPYTVHAGRAWTRREDADTSEKLANGALLYVQLGAVGSGYYAMTYSDAVFALDTTDQVWALV